MTHHGMKWCWILQTVHACCRHMPKPCKCAVDKCTGHKSHWSSVLVSGTLGFNKPASKEHHEGLRGFDATGELGHLQSWEEAAIELGWLFVAHGGRYMPGHPEIGVLVDGARNEALQILAVTEHVGESYLRSRGLLALLERQPCQCYLCHSSQIFPCIGFAVTALHQHAKIWSRLLALPALRVWACQDASLHAGVMP